MFGKYLLGLLILSSSVFAAELTDKEKFEAAEAKGLEEAKASAQNFVTFFSSLRSNAPEGAVISESELAQLRADLKAAQSLGDVAKTLAEGADAKAVAAQTAADGAKTLAVGADSKAVAAQTKADDAESKAVAAQDKANVVFTGLVVLYGKHGNLTGTFNNFVSAAQQVLKPAPKVAESEISTDDKNDQTNDKYWKDELDWRGRSTGKRVRR